MDKAALLLTLYNELACEGYAPGSITDVCLGMIYDAVSDRIPFDKTRAEDLDAYHALEDLAGCADYAKAKPAETAALRRAQEAEAARLTERERLRIEHEEWKKRHLPVYGEILASGETAEVAP